MKASVLTSSTMFLKASLGPFVATKNLTSVEKNRLEIINDDFLLSLLCEESSTYDRVQNSWPVFRWRRLMKKWCLYCMRVVWVCSIGSRYLPVSKVNTSNRYQYLTVRIDIIFLGHNNYLAC